MIALVVVVIGTTSFAYFSFSTLNQVEVNGPIYKEVVAYKDLIADILPPPDYIIESYLYTYQLREDINDPAKVAGDEAYFTDTLKAQYYERHQVWVDYLESGPMKTMMVETSFKPAEEFYNVVENEYFPAEYNP